MYVPIHCPRCGRFTRYDRERMQWWCDRDQMTPFLPFGELLSRFLRSALLGERR